jgi:predicted transport protein
MPLFQTNNEQVNQVPIDLKQFKDEAALRDFFAVNLEKLLGLRFLGKEYPTKDGRIDTLAIDETGTPVIIEYKWGEKDNILSQGLFYIDWLKENKRLFDLLVADKLGKENKVIWDSPRLLLIAQGFDRYTLSAVRQVKNSVELIKYTPYSSQILFLETVYSPDTVKPKSEIASKKEQGVYGIEYHLSKVNSDIKEIFYVLQAKIKQWPNVEEKADQKVGITYRTTKSFVRFEFGKSYIDVLVRDSRYGHKIDPKGMLKDISSFEWGYKGRAKLKSKEDIDYVLNLISMSYETTL